MRTASCARRLFMRIGEGLLSKDGSCLSRWFKQLWEVLHIEWPEIRCRQQNRSSVSPERSTSSILTYASWLQFDTSIEERSTVMWLYNLYLSYFAMPNEYLPGVFFLPTKKREVFNRNQTHYIWWVKTVYAHEYVTVWFVAKTRRKYGRWIEATKIWWSRSVEKWLSFFPGTTRAMDRSDKGIDRWRITEHIRRN